MLYCVHIQVTPENGNRLDASGGPGRMFGYVNERFKPQGWWIDPSQRQGWLIVDVNGIGDIAELMMVFSRFTGSHPTCTPVVPAQEIPGMIRAADEHLKQLG
jgi:hypothetical protein